MAGVGPFGKHRPGDARPADDGDAVSAELAALAGEAAGPHGGASPAGQRSERGRTASLARALAAGSGRGVRRASAGARIGLAGLTGRLVRMAPRIPVRDLRTLREQYPGLGPEEIADRLVAGAVRNTGAVGAAIGAAAAVPIPASMPAEVAAEILAVSAIEIKLVAELHEVYGHGVPGNAARRGLAYLGSWAEQSGIDITELSTLNVMAGGRLRRELRQQVVRRTVRNLPMLAPFMIGAVVGAAMNRRETRKLADRLRRDLAQRQSPWDGPPHGASGLWGRRPS